jgi:hypothetical protein
VGKLSSRWGALKGEADPVKGEADPIKGEADPIKGEADPVKGDVVGVSGILCKCQFGFRLPPAEGRGVLVAVPVGTVKKPERCLRRLFQAGCGNQEQQAAEGNLYRFPTACGSFNRLSLTLRELHTRHRADAILP